MMNAALIAFFVAQYPHPNAIPSFERSPRRNNETFFLCNSYYHLPGGIANSGSRPGWVGAGWAGAEWAECGILPRYSAKQSIKAASARQPTATFVKSNRPE